MIIYYFAPSALTLIGPEPKIGSSNLWLALPCCAFGVLSSRRRAFWRVKTKGLLRLLAQGTCSNGVWREGNVQHHCAENSRECYDGGQGLHHCRFVWSRMGSSQYQDEKIPGTSSWSKQCQVKVYIGHTSDSMDFTFTCEIIHAARHVLWVQYFWFPTQKIKNPIMPRQPRSQQREISSG